MSLFAAFVIKDAILVTKFERVFATAEVLPETSPITNLLKTIKIHYIKISLRITMSKKLCHHMELFHLKYSSRERFQNIFQKVIGRRRVVQEDRAGLQSRLEGRFSVMPASYLHSLF